MESNLLKEAIADAKAVRATALANAKVALEEAFAPRFHAMFADKLKEEAGVKEEEVVPPVTEETVTESEIDELIKELENEVGDDAPPAPMGGAEAPPMGGAEELPMDAAPDAMPAGEGAPLTAGQTVKLVPVPDAGAALPPAPEGGEEVPPVPPMGGEGEEGQDEEVDLNELLESLKEEAEEQEEQDESVLKENVPVKSSAVGGKVGGSDNKKPSNDASATSHIETAGKDRVGMPTAKVTAQEPTNASRPNAGPVTPSKMDTPKLAKEAVETGVPGGSVTAKEPTEADRPNEGPVTKTDMSTPALAKENAMLKKQLGEATDTVTYIKGQLNEINLLNAKLLYTNKLFKEFTMNNEQKMRVVEMFDLSKNVREVKLTYATIAESLNFSGDMKKRPSSSVQSITEGMASKQVASTKPSKAIISEGQFASRMKKLAGIRNEPPKK